MNENQIGEAIVDAAFRIHSAVGPGCLESAYGALMAYELEKQGHAVEAEVPVSVTYGNLTIPKAFFMDLLVDNLVVVELKAVEELAPVHFKQVITHLKFADKRLGFLINFNTPLLKHGIRRIVNGLKEK